jgi:toxin ParE1/3/4
VRRRKVLFSDGFFVDLEGIHNQIAFLAWLTIAHAYIDRIETFCDGFDLASERGTRRDDLLPGLRVIGFEKRVSLLVRVMEDHVLFTRAFYGGQDWEAAFREDDA